MQLKKRPPDLPPLLPSLGRQFEIQVRSMQAGVTKIYPQSEQCQFQDVHEHGRQPHVLKVLRGTLPQRDAILKLHNSGVDSSLDSSLEKLFSLDTFRNPYSLTTQLVHFSRPSDYKRLTFLPKPFSLSSTNTEQTTTHGVRAISSSLIADASCTMLKVLAAKDVRSVGDFVANTTLSSRLQVKRSKLATAVVSSCAVNSTAAVIHRGIAQKGVRNTEFAVNLAQIFSEQHQVRQSLRAKIAPGEHREDAHAPSTMWPLFTVDLPDASNIHESRRAFILGEARSSECVSAKVVQPTEGRDSHGFPLRRPKVRSLSTHSRVEIEDWYQAAAMTTGPLLSEKNRERYIRILHTWKDLDAKQLSDIPATDIYVHRVRLKEGTKPHSSKRRMRRTEQQTFWLEKTIREGRDTGMFESTIMANGKLSNWNADAVVVMKPGADQTSANPEMRCTFDYSNVEEEIPGMWLNLTDEVHDFLSNPRVKIFGQFDIKNAYWSLPVHKDDRHILAFYIQGIGQLQPTRMPQGEQSSGFSMAEVMTIALGPIPALPDEFHTSESDGSLPSLLGKDSINADPECAFYFDDIFSAHETEEQVLDFLEFHFFPRIAWAKLRLSFVKMKLFMRKIKALGMEHSAGGVVKIIPSRIQAISEIKPPKTQTQVRKFLGSIGICRRWIKNYSEIARPLTRLTGKVDFRWEGAEQLAFKFLQEKVVSTVEAHGWDNKLPVILYSDASQYGAGCCIVQNRPLSTTQQIVEHPIVLDSFTFNKTERNYGTYKRELLAIVTFCRKFYYMLRNEQTAVIKTDHQPLIHFLNSHLVHGIYSRWAAELQLLNVTIEYIPGEKNVVADSLSRVVFPDEECKVDQLLASMGELSKLSEHAEWVWKDGKGGYEQLLAARREAAAQNEPLSAETFVNSASVSTSLTPIEPYEAHLKCMAANVNINATSDRYSSDVYFKDIFKFLVTGEFPLSLGALERRKLQLQASKYRLSSPLHVNGKIEGDLLYVVRGKWKRCVPRLHVAALIHSAHDLEGHWKSVMTLKKLKEYWWPDMVRDVKQYILGCLQCAKHGNSQRSQTQSPIVIDQPGLLVGMDFVGPFPGAKLSLAEAMAVMWPTLPNSKRFTKYRKTKNQPPSLPAEDGLLTFTHILVVCDYFNRWCFGFPVCGATQEETIRCLTWIWDMEGAPVAVYTDAGTHFTGKKAQEFFKERGVLYLPAPSKGHNATGMIEKCNDLLETVIKLSSAKNTIWPMNTQDGIFQLNRRDIAHIGSTPFEIRLGYQPASAVELNHSSLKRAQVVSFMTSTTDFLENFDEDAHATAVFEFIAAQEERHERVRQKSEDQKQLMKERYDRSITNPRSFDVGDMVMLYDTDTAHKKLQPSFRGPFAVQGFGGNHSRTYKLQQLNGKPIKGIFYGDHLKLFKLRPDHLMTGEESLFPLYQNIRARTGIRRLPETPLEVSSALVNLSDVTLKSHFHDQVSLPAPWFEEIG